MTAIKLATLLQLLWISSSSAFAPVPKSVSTSSTIISTQLPVHSSSSSENNDMDMGMDRREAIGNFATILTTGTGTVAAATIANPEPASAAQGMPLFAKVAKLETANYMGRVGQPIYPANTNGDPEKHMPTVSIDKDNNLEISTSATHVMTEEHYIQFMWLKDAKTNDVVVAKEFTPSEDRAVLKVKVPSGVELTPYLFCNLHGLWKGESFNVA